MKKIAIAFCVLCVLACVSYAQAEDPGQFAGMAKVKVVSVDNEDGDLTIFVKFLAVQNAWNRNQAGDAKHLIDKKFMLVGNNEKIKKFLALLTVGEEVVIGVETNGEKVLKLVELTYEQRDMVK